MSEDNKEESKRGFPNGFIWFLMAAFILALMVQNFVDTKVAKVSFSYQLENLVNLQLIQPEDSRKIALNDNLVTFSGKFREQLTDEGKNRYKFLELLNTNHELTQDRQEIEQSLSGLQNKIQEAGGWFLRISGIAIPSGGYVVVDDLYSGYDKDHSVTITQLVGKKGKNFFDVERLYNTATSLPTEENAKQTGTALADLISQFRTPMLGIGNEQMKQMLRSIDKDVTQANKSTTMPLGQRLTVYGSGLERLQGIIDQLNEPVDHVRLSPLRSTRNYKDAIDKYNQLSTQLNDNEAQLDKAAQKVSHVIWFFNNKELSTRALEQQDYEVYHHWFLSAKEEWGNFPANRGGVFKAPDQPLNKVLEKTFKSEEPSPNYLSYLFTILPIVLVVVILYFLFSRQMKGMGSTAMNFGKSPAKLLQKGSHKITFDDVAGVDEALEELQEIVDFLKDPHRFTSLGGHIPKGVLCIGPPGTGKTLIAKAVAGEADRPFFSISGSDFVEMFVGVGASRIRDMFEQAKKQAPCIIFMDEIDAVGRHRGAGIGGGHDEREQTLNQLLVEMDGFDTNDGVILIAATNRPDVLDKALLRPGRFDRRVVINLPDIKGRFDILKVHAKKIKLDTTVDLMDIARGTPGSSGADLENILNESALIAARRGRSAVTQPDLKDARDKVLYGKERRSMELDESEKRTTAYHESGHTVVGQVVQHSDPVEKVTIIPRGMSLGATHFLPKKNRVSYWKKELIDQLAVLMGGRCAEEIFVGDISSGAQQDIEQATHLARSMVCEWGMSDKLGVMSYDERSESGQYLGMSGYHEKKYSEDTAKTIDDEVRRMLDEAHDRAIQIIQDHKEQVELMTQMLMQYESLDSIDIAKIMKGDWDTDDKDKRLKHQEELHKKGLHEPEQPEEKSEAGVQETPPTPAPSIAS